MIPFPSLTGGRNREHSCLAKASVDNIITYPYPKGEHNGAIGPKYASYRNVNKRKKTLL
jgi:hypothetical protein